MVVEIFIARYKAVDALAKQLWERMLHIALISMIGEAVRKAIGDAQALVELADEQQSPFVAEMAAAEISLKFTASEILKIERWMATVCQSLVLSFGFANSMADMLLAILNTKLAQGP